MRTASTAISSRARAVARSRAGKAVGTLLALLIVVPGVLYALPEVVGKDDAFLVLSGSMVPFFEPGDVIFVDAVDPASLQVGDVVTFRAKPGSATLITHRVIEVLDDGETIRYRTQGDANDDPDPFVVKQEMVVGKYSFQIPHWGLLVKTLRSKAGYLGLVLFPASLVILREFVKLYKELDAADKRKRQEQTAKMSKLFGFMVVLMLFGQFVTTAPFQGGLLQATLPAGATFAYFLDEEETEGSITAGDFVIGCPNAAPPRPRAPGATYANDPGFAFRDANCNGQYDFGIDSVILTATLRAGTVDVGPACLVIPPSVGNITASHIDYKASGGMVVAVNLTATSGNLKVSSATRIVAEGVVLRARMANLDVLGGEVRANRSELLTSAGGTIRVETPAGKRVWLSNSTAYADSNLQISAGGNIDATDSALRSIRGNIQIRSEIALLMPRVVLRAPSGNVQFDAVGGQIDMEDAILHSASGNLQPKAGGQFKARNACLRSDGNVQITAESAVSGRAELSGSTILSIHGAIEIVATRDHINITGASLLANGHVTLKVDGNVLAQVSRIESETGAIDVEVRRISNRFHVMAAWFEDDDDVVRLKPAGALVVGTPSHGTVAA